MPPEAQRAGIVTVDVVSEATSALVSNRHLPIGSVPMAMRPTFTTGTPIGSSGGVVRSIEPRRVVIEESARDFYGDVKSKEVVMELPQEDRSP